MSSLLLGSGLPGGMMGSMMADLGPIQKMINKEREKKGESTLTMDDMLVKLFNEYAREAVQRGRVRMAEGGLSPTGNPVLSVHQEHRADEPPHHGAGQGSLCDDGRCHLGFAM